jgi:phytoene dehydrogenase-like protein
MSSGYDAIVIGAGHNGLITAGYLAGAGVRTVVLERGSEVGGALSTSVVEGTKVPAVAHTVGRLRADVISDLDLQAHGFTSIVPDVRVWAPQPDGPPITLYGDMRRTSLELQAHGMSDAMAYAEFDELVRALAGFLARINDSIPPAIDGPSLSDARSALGLGRAFRGLDKKHAQSLMRVLPMAVADFVGEHFSSEFVKGVMATRGVLYTAMGPWSSGTTAVLVGDSAGNDGGAAGQTVYARGGPGALAQALLDAARSFGAEVITEADVTQISTDADGRAVGIVLASGEEIAGRAVVSGTDPKRTLRDLIDPVVMGPHMRWRANNIRMPGSVAKVNLVLSELPRFPSLDDGVHMLEGRIVIAPGIDYLERAHDASKYGRVAEAPYLEATIPTLSDPSLAPDGVHVMSILVQYVPYHRRDGDWDADRDNFGDFILKTMGDYAPGIADLVTARQVLTPLDLERDYGLTEGHPLHGEPGLDQFYAWRPLWGHARHRLGIEGLYLCGSGAHPGGGITGGPGRNAAQVIIKDLKRRKKA